MEVNAGRRPAEQAFHHGRKGLPGGGFQVLSRQIGGDQLARGRFFLEECLHLGVSVVDSAQVIRHDKSLMGGPHDAPQGGIQQIFIINPSDGAGFFIGTHQRITQHQESGGGNAMGKPPESTPGSRKDNNQRSLGQN
ncbi:hypothetical protein D3C81_1806620 [compost metagenome]